MKDNCFTVLCWFLPYVNINQPQVYMCPLPLESLTPLVVTEPGLSSLNHTANSHWLSLSHMVMYVSLLLSPLVPPSPRVPATSTPPHTVSTSLFSMDRHVLIRSQRHALRLHQEINLPTAQTWPSLPPGSSSQRGILS